jgi:hypothetical protein
MADTFNAEGIAGTKTPANGVCECCGVPSDNEGPVLRIWYNKEKNEATIVEFIRQPENFHGFPVNKVVMRKVIPDFL